VVHHHSTTVGGAEGEFKPNFLDGVRVEGERGLIVRAGVVGRPVVCGICLICCVFVVLFAARAALGCLTGR